MRHPLPPTILLLLAACGPGGGPEPDDAGLITDAGMPHRDGGSVPVYACVPSRFDLVTTHATDLRVTPDAGSKLLRRLDAGTLVIPLPTEADGRSCPDAGFYDVQQLTRRGWVAGDDLAPGPCTRGSAFDAGIQAVVKKTFGDAGTDAVKVIKCESGAKGTDAVNGQYFGLFQMGEYERGSYGDSLCAEGESLAAFTYFVATGSDWSPWSCKP